ncbi:hypothetical protein HAX54_019396 [Datura stramonium]|uniref:Uncharacterized protein n=1 Tax=Datura stramonium TaxID=4076 RepID=A0ABS8S1R3_DATST|nr:hypothetical protein [Datura stramonium]
MRPSLYHQNQDNLARDVWAMSCAPTAVAAQTHPPIATDLKLGAAVQLLDRVVAEQSRLGHKPSIGFGECTRISRTREFIALNPPEFSREIVNEDRQDFVDQLYRIFELWSQVHGLSSLLRIDFTARLTESVAGSSTPTGSSGLGYCWAEGKVEEELPCRIMLIPHPMTFTLDSQRSA